MQRFIMLCVLSTTYITMNACNICGCSVMNGSPGILPKFRTHFIGLRHTHRSFTSTHPASILNPEVTKSKDIYRSTELWGRWYPHKRIQVFAFVPFNSFERNEDKVNKSIAGIGDASLMVNYLLLNTADSSKSKLKQAFLIGALYKHNTGKFDRNETPNFQLGSGTRDVQSYLSYTLRYGMLGLMTESSYRWIGINPNHYELGNRFNVSSKLFYWIKYGNNSLLPHVGIIRESAEADRLKGTFQDYTGGNSTLAGLGLDAYIGNVNIGINGYLPIIQNLGDGMVYESPRIQMNLIYNFKQKKSCN